MRVLRDVRVLSRGGAAFLLTILVACKNRSTSDPDPVPTPTPTPTPLPPQVVAQHKSLALEAGWVAWLPFPISRAPSRRTSTGHAPTTSIDLVGASVTRTSSSPASAVLLRQERRPSRRSAA
jgi:hypothetical protein